MEVKRIISMEDFLCRVFELSRIEKLIVAQKMIIHCLPDYYPDTDLLAESLKPLTRYIDSHLA